MLLSESELSECWNAENCLNHTTRILQIKEFFKFLILQILIQTRPKFYVKISFFLNNNIAVVTNKIIYPIKIDKLRMMAGKF